MIKNNLKILRTALNMSQGKLGEDAKVSKQYIAKIERGERNPSNKILEKLATKLKVELSELLERPKLTSEIFIEYVSKKNISYNDVLKITKLNDISLRLAFINDPIYSFNGCNYSLDNYYTLGTCLGFSKDFLEKRLDIDSQIRELENYDPYESINEISDSYETWTHNFYIQYNLDLGKLFSEPYTKNSSTTFQDDLKEFKCKYSEVPEVSIDDISNLFYSTVSQALNLAKTSSILNYGMDDFEIGEVDEVNNFLVNSFIVKVNEILTRHRKNSSNLQPLSTSKSN